MNGSSNREIPGAFTRKALRNLWRDFEWPVVGLLALIAMILAHFGYWSHLKGQKPPPTFWDLLYFDLQLFLIQMPNLTPPLNPALNVGRFLAPAVAGYTAWQALAELFSDQLQSFRLRLKRDHIVICGLGRKALVLAREFLRRGNGVVVIEQDEENDFVRQCRDLGALVLVGDASEPDLLRRAGVARAKNLFAMCGDDGVNAEVAVRAAGIVGRHDATPLSCIVHIFDPQLCALLRERELETLSGRGIRLEFFNVFELGARVLLEDYRFTQDGGRIVVIGVGHLGESLITTAARQWRRSQPKVTRRLAITLVDANAPQIAETLRARYPGLDQACELSASQMDVRSAEFARGEFLKATAGDGGQSIFICLDDDSLALSAALAIARKVDGEQSTIIVRMTQDAGLATLLRGIPHEHEHFRHLRSFALLDRACQPEQVLRGSREILARAIHSEYLRHQRTVGDTPEKNPSMRPWDELPDDLKESNRQQADDLRAKLDLIGYRLEPVSDWDETVIDFSAAELEVLAKHEHVRWMNEKRRAGWRFGSKKDATEKTHPCLVQYSELPEEEKNKDRNTVRALPELLASLGFRLRRMSR
jgi:hypothetical protein